MRLHFSRPLLWAWLCLGSPSFVWAQISSGTATKPGSPAAPPSTAVPSPAALAAEPLVIRQSEMLFSFNADGTGFREQTLAVAVQSEAALRAFNVLTIPFAGASERVKFRYARVRHADGTVAETAPETALEQPQQVTREAPLYSDLKQMQLPLRNLRVGDTIEWQVHIDRVKAEAPGQFWGRQSLFEGVVALAEKVELRVPASSTVTVWTNPRLKTQPVSTTEAGQRIYRWNTSALQLTAGPEAQAAAKTKAKLVLTADEELDAKYGKLPDMAWTSFPSWDAVGGWYRSLEAGRTAPNDAVTAKVKELTAGKATLQEKAQAVYTYVSGQVHYVGVDFGVGRYQPHHAEEVLDSQYGDCKDKHTLLAAMLSVLGLHPDAVLIGSGIRFNEAVPSPDTFNHLITQVQVGPQQVWLDSTEEVAPYGMLFATLRDKQALVVPDAGTARIERTPADPPFPTFEKMTASGSLDAEGISESHFTLTQRGDEELLVRSILRQVTPAQYDELTQRLVGNMGFSGTVSHAQFLHIEDTTEPLVMDWDYHREKAGDDWGNLRTLPQLMLVLLPSVDEKEPPVADLQIFGARSVTSTSEMKLPAGWSAEVPEAVHAKSEFGTYDLTFRYEKNTLYADRQWTVLKKEVPQADWKRYKAWLDQMSIATEPFVQLRKPVSITSVPPLKSKALVSPSADPESLRLIAEAYKAINANRLDEGSALLDKARALDPKQRNLWGDYGWVAWKRGDHLEAMRLYQKELDAYPDSLWAYKSLSQLQVLTGNANGAEVTMRRYVAQVPNDPAAAAALINFLIGQHKYSEAVAAVDDALLRLPASATTNAAFQLAAGKAQLLGGKLADGVAMLTSLIQSTTDPNLLNVAAYELSAANQALPLAETTERQVLAALEADTATWTLAEPPATLHTRSSLLTASWDTMGWILYREGKFAEAEPYIQARWQYKPFALIGEHLGDVQLAQGHKREALRTYRLALATISPVDAMGVRRSAPTPETTELNERIAKLQGVADGEAAPDSSKELQAMRTFPLPSASGHDGVVEYKLLLCPDGVRLAAPAGTNDLAGGTDLLKTAKLSRDFFPPGSHAFLMRNGTLNCHAGHCELILMP